ncbi:hypothetical protein ACHAXR_006066, partial [Thalassiosira sp. AJA248-18]
MISIFRTLFLLFLLLDNSAAITFRHKSEIPKDDPYKVLGVKNTATDEVIQKAYRQKARETHPDKNPSPHANDEFRRVSDAFEILGNPASRRKHDNTMRQEAQRRRRAQDQHRRQEDMKRKENDRARKERQRRHRDMLERASAMQSRMVKISTMEQFEKVMLHSSKKFYKTHCLIMFVGNRSAEKKGEEDFYFPYPFENDKNTLQIAKASDAVGNFQIFHPRRQRQGGDIHAEFKKWVESNMLISAIVANSHSLPVQLFIIRDTSVLFSDSLPPYHQISLNLQAGDRIIAFDDRVDTFPSSGPKTRTMDNIIKKPTGVLFFDDVAFASNEMFTIKAKRCYDLSTQCYDWALSSRGKMNQQCQLNPEFMHSVCPHSCGVCSEHFASDLSYLAFHYPIHRFPTLLQGIVRSGRYMVDDIRNISKLRKNAAAAFFALGLFCAFNIALLRQEMTSKSAMRSSPQLNQHSEQSNLIDSILLLIAVTMSAGMKWIMSASVRGVPLWLRVLHRDFTGV